MKDILLDTLIDSVKLVPFLFITFLLMELIEHKLSKKSEKTIEKAGKFGPIIGSLLGAIPQCGFSVAATNFFSARIVSMGTLVAIYLSTSDEMIPILISEKANVILILKIIALKIIIGMAIGLLIDFIFNKRVNKNNKIHDLCEEENCGCKNHLLISVIKHTWNIIIFIALISFVLNSLFYFIGEDNLSKYLLKNSIFEPFITSLIGLIPNCGASVVITELYLKSTISFGALISGLLTGSGVALMVLFKENKNLKENLCILGIIYLVGSIFGIILNLIGVAF